MSTADERGDKGKAKTRSRTSALKPEWERCAQKTVNFVDWYWNHTNHGVSTEYHLEVAQNSNASQWKCLLRYVRKWRCLDKANWGWLKSPQQHSKAHLQEPNKSQVEYTPPLQRGAVLMSLSCCNDSGCSWCIGDLLSLLHHIRFSLLHRQDSDWRGFLVSQNCCK